MPVDEYGRIIPIEPVKFHSNSTIEGTDIPEHRPTIVEATIRERKGMDPPPEPRDTVAYRVKRGKVEFHAYEPLLHERVERLERQVQALLANASV